jgi:hypothetical protein
MTWNESRSIVVGFDSNKFHEFWCSHLSCRIFDFCTEKNYFKWWNGVHHCEGLVETIKTDILLAIFGVQNKKISIRNHACIRRFQRTREDTGPKMGPNGHYSGPASPRPMLAGTPYTASLRASRNFLPRLLGSHLCPFEVGLSNGGRGRSHGSMTWQLLGLYSTLGYIRTPPPPPGDTPLHLLCSKVSRFQTLIVVVSL